ncbi:MAG: hypothetical protein WD226_03475 [Planctomycetota bacterium]
MMPPDKWLALLGLITGVIASALLALSLNRLVRAVLLSINAFDVTRQSYLRDARDVPVFLGLENHWERGVRSNRNCTVIRPPRGKFRVSVDRSVRLNDRFQGRRQPKGQRNGKVFRLQPLRSQHGYLHEMQQRLVQELRSQRQGALPQAARVERVPLLWNEWLGKVGAIECANTSPS